MRKLLLLIAILLPLHQKAHGQIVLSSASYPASLTGTDSLKTTTSASLFPDFSPAANGLWDMSIVTDSTPVFFRYRVPSLSYQFADSVWHNIFGFQYQGNVECDITSTNLNQYGVSTPRSAHSISSMTAGPFDSFIVNLQFNAFSSPREILFFPTLISSSWSSSFRSDLQFLLTFLMLGDTLAPGIVRRYTTEKDSVVGWGKMRVTDSAGAPSAYLNVLQVQTMITYTDSFFLKGAPFSNTMLTFFSVTQGQRDTVYEQNYYRLQEVTPLARVEFRDAGYTQPYKATTHVQRLSNVGVAVTDRQAGIKLYPNPANSRVINLAMPPISGEWQYRLLEISGKCMMKGSINPGSTQVNLQLPATLAGGIYYLELIGEAAQKTVLPLELAD